MDAPDRWASDDPLGEALHFMRMRGAFYCRSQLTSPWGLELPAIPGYLWLHVLISGRCWLETDGTESLLLQPGDLALVPHGDGHSLRSEPDADTDPILELKREYVSDRYEIVRHGGGGPASSMVCTAVGFDHPAAAELIRLLPPMIHVEASSPLQLDWTYNTIRLMTAEAKELRPGGETVITRLADVLVIQAIRSWIDNEPAAQAGWIGALQDRQIGRAITLIHRDAGRPWTVALLADEVAMSRSSFSARFTDLVGETAMRYVARWRLKLAMLALRDEGATVGDVSGRFGYQSEAAFARAFKRVVGVSPGGLRRNGAARQHNDVSEGLRNAAS